MSEFLATINWRTTGYALAYLVCSAAAGMFPELNQTMCSWLEKLIVAGGFVSAADATRIQSVIRTVDLLAFKNRIDPATLIPLELLPAPAVEVK